MSSEFDKMLRFPWRTDVYLLVLTAAIDGRTIFYSDLPGGRYHWGKYLARIAAEEARQGRPPLTAIVVAKGTGRPQSGFKLAMAGIGYPVGPGESDEDVWRRASSEVHAYWRRG